MSGSVLDHEGRQGNKAVEEQAGKNRRMKKSLFGSFLEGQIFPECKVVRRWVFMVFLGVAEATASVGTRVLVLNHP